MKHIFFPLLFFSFSVTVLAQIIPPEMTQPGNKFFRRTQTEFSILVSYLYPVGSFGDSYRQGASPNIGSSLKQSLEGEVGGMGAYGGGGLDFSMYRYFNKQPVQPTGGVKITFLSFDAIPFKWNTDGQYAYNDANYTGMRFLSFKLGPVVRIAAGDNVSIRIDDQLCFAIGWNGSWSNTLDYTYYSGSDFKNVVHDESDFKLGTGSGIKNETNISVSIGRFMAAAGYSFGKIKYEQVEYNRNATIDTYQLNESGNYVLISTTGSKNNETLRASMPTNYLFFSLGYMWGK